jgi:hypothetical protein
LLRVFTEKEGKKSKKSKKSKKALGVKIKKSSKIVQKYFFYFFLGGGRGGQCIRLFKKCDPNPQSWTSPIQKKIPKNFSKLFYA